MTWLDGAADGLQRATAADLATWLPDDLLVKFDRISMAHSLEGRTPYLAPGVVEAGLALPLDQRMNGAISKVALRRVASRWIPRAIVIEWHQAFAGKRQQLARAYRETVAVPSAYAPSQLPTTGISPLSP